MKMEEKISAIEAEKNNLQAKSKVFFLLPAVVACSCVMVSWVRAYPFKCVDMISLMV